MIAETRILDILIVEDNPADRYLIEEAVQNEDPTCRMQAIGDGDSAIAYLSRHRPDIVVLDLNIPRRDGIEVLKFIRGQSRLAGVVVVIFSSSPKDAIERQAPQADAHVQKPFDLDVFMKIGERVMKCFWHAQESR